MARNRETYTRILGQREFHLKDPRSPGQWACVSVEVVDVGDRMRVRVSPHGYRVSDAVREANPGAAALFGVLELPGIGKDRVMARLVQSGVETGKTG